MRSAGYAFRPMQAADLPLVRGWLAAPHVARWWGDPDEQFGLVSEDLNHPSMAQFIVASDEAVCLSAMLRSDRVAEQRHLGALPDGVRGIDQFIGEPDMIERPRLRADPRLRRRCWPPAPRVVTDPIRRTLAR